MSAHRARSLITASERAVSIDKTVYEEGNEKFADVHLASAHDIEVEALHELQWREVQDAISDLEAEDQELLRRRFGLDGTEFMTCKQLGDQEGVDPETIRRKEKILVVRLRSMLRA